MLVINWNKTNDAAATKPSLHSGVSEMSMRSMAKVMNVWIDQSKVDWAKLTNKHYWFLDRHYNVNGM